jgi:hypothetical protein
MSIDNQFLIKKVTQRDSFIACFCTATRMPFLYCDPVSYADQVWIFADEDGLKEFAGRFAAKKIPLQGALIRKNQFTGFFGSLLHIGVTEIVFTENGASVPIPIDQFVRFRDMSKVPEALRPLENPQLMLTGIYLMQEVVRKVPQEEKEDLKDLNEEFLVNLARARFLIPVQVKEGPGTIPEKMQKGQFSFLNLTMKNGDVYRPIFGDNMEFQKFRQQKQEIQAITMPFAGLKTAFPKDVKGYLLNPNGCQIVIQMILIDQVLKSFPDDVKQGAAEAVRLAQTLAGPRAGRKSAAASLQGHSKVTKMPEKESAESGSVEKESAEGGSAEKEFAEDRSVKTGSSGKESAKKGSSEE